MRQKLLGLLPAVVVLACGWSAAQPMAAVRLTHLSPDAPQFDLVVDQQLFMRDIAYGEVSPYNSLPAGQHEISVFPHRLRDSAGGDEEGPRVLEPITVLVDFEDGAYYTLAISGFYQEPARDGASGALAVEVVPSEARVVVNGPRGFVQSFQGETVLGELEPGNYTVRAEHQDHQPATFEVSVQEDRTSTVSISLQEGEGGVSETGLESDSTGASGWRPVELHAFRDELGAVPPPGGSRLRLVHLSPSTSSVDLLAIPADGAGEPAMLASGLSFPNSSPYTRLPGSNYTIQVRLEGADAILTQVRDVTIQAGGVYTLFLVREPADNYLRLIPAVDMLLTVRR